MIARLYVAGQLLATVDVKSPLGRSSVPRPLTVNDTLTLILTDEHPKPTDRALFLEGRLESA